MKASVRDSDPADVVADFSATLAEAQSLLKRAASATGSMASDLRSQVDAKLLSAKLKLQDLQDDAVGGAKAAARATDDYVRDNPWQTIGAATLAGFFAGVCAGVILERRRSD